MRCFFITHTLSNITWNVEHYKWISVKERIQCLQKYAVRFYLGIYNNKYHIKWHQQWNSCKIHLFTLWNISQVTLYLRVYKYLWTFDEYTYQTYNNNWEHFDNNIYYIIHFCYNIIIAQTLSRLWILLLYVIWMLCVYNY